MRSDRDDVANIIRWVAGSRGSRVEVVCAEHPDPRRGITGPFVVQLAGCAEGLSLADYLLLYAAGVRVHVRTDGCAAAEQVQANVRAARHFLCCAERGTGGLVAGPCEGRSKRDVHQLAALHLSRRQLLGGGAQRRVNLPDPDASERERLLFALAQTCGDDAMPEKLASEPAPSARLVANGCDGCGVCVRACREDALHLQRDDEGFALVLQHRACTDCGSCVSLCPQHALSQQGVVTWGDVIEDRRTQLASGAMRTCARCGAGFMPATAAHAASTGDFADTAAAPASTAVLAQGEERYCAPCSFRMANPFGSALAPGR